jgi:hypothetical protein
MSEETLGSIRPWQIFVISGLLSGLLGLLFRGWLLFVVVAWGMFALGGVVPLSLKRPKYLAFHFGSLAGLTVALAFILWVPV